MAATEKRNDNVSKRVTMEHFFKEKGKQEIAKKENTKMAYLYVQGQKKK